MYRSTVNGKGGAEVLRDLMAERGPYLDPVPVDPEVIAHYETRLPPLLLDLWENYGLGGFAEGRIRFILPSEYDEALQTLFRGDPDFGADCHAIAIGPFGDLMVWSERYQLLFIGLPLQMVDAPFRTHPLPGDQADVIVLNYVLKADPLVFDTADDDGEPMFARALAALGPLKRGEIYGTVPAVSVGEPLAVDRLQKVIATEWLVERFSGGVFTLVDLSSRRVNIRKIGGPILLEDEP